MCAAGGLRGVPRSIVETLLARSGRTRADIPAQSTLGKLFRRQGVNATDELRRIAQIPRRQWEADPDLPEFCVQITEWLRTSSGTMQLKPVQAAALADLHDFHCLVAPIRVGGGKTLISLLAGTVLELDRVCLLIPAKLRRKTERAIVEMRRHWRIPRQLLVLTYERLSRDSGEGELTAFQPEIIIADEAHKLKNLRAACTRRVKRYLSGHPDTIYVDLSGTITKRSILEYAHRLAWSLPAELVPLPATHPERIEWALALDAKVPTHRRYAPGALLQLCDPTELAGVADDPTDTARRAYGRRLTETPGIISTQDVHDADCSIVIEGIHDLRFGRSVTEAFQQLRMRWETPDGHAFSEATELWRHARELVCGFYYRWNPRPPAEWIEARREWHKFVRDALKSHRKFDTPMQVAKACVNGQLPGGAYTQWKALEPAFKPQSEPVWIDRTTLDRCAHWLATEGGICWVEHVAFGERLAAVTGLPYFAGGGIDRKTKAYVEDWRGPCIASIAAINEGVNLQYHHSKNFIASCPPGGTVWEQMIGRTHRDGQEADEVTFDVLLNCIEQWEAFQQALLDAAYAQSTMQQPQKLCMADITVISQPEVEILQAKKDPLWDKFD